MSGNPIWFVRADNANRPHPVTTEGWGILLALLMGCVFAVVAAFAVSFVMPELPWLPVVIVVVMGVGDAVVFLLIARPRTDMSITVSEFNSGRTS
mgnify:CR=1 FL=1